MVTKFVGKCEECGSDNIKYSQDDFIGYICNDCNYVDHWPIEPARSEPIKSNNRIIFVDLDGTLFKDSWLSNIIFRVARLFRDIAYRFQKVDVQIRDQMRKYDKIIILTGRSLSMLGITMDQLHTHKIEFNKVIMCDRQNLFVDWKKNVINNNSEQSDNITWLDDEK